MSSSPTLNTFKSLDASDIDDLHRLVGIQSSPNIRGTFEIVWSCFTVLFICVYVSSHFDVREHKGGKLHLILYKIGQMCFTVLFPEWLLGTALVQFFHAREGVKLMTLGPGAIGKQSLTSKKYRPHGPVDQWSMAQSFFVNMGGFRIVFLDKSILTPDRFQLYSLVKSNIVELPESMMDEINDKSKADPLIKAFACLQSAWLVLQSIARATQRLPISELEITTTAYVACTLGAYAFWLYKPYNVTVPITIECPRIESMERFQSCWDDTSTFPLSALEMEMESATVRDENSLRACVTRSPNDAAKTTLGLDFFEYFGLSFTLTAFTFGAVHCAAWNFTFPTNAEQTAWRTCSAVILGMPVLLVIYAILEVASEGFILFIAFLYAICRVVLLALAIMSLRLMPAGVYLSPDWTAFIPHLS